MNHHRRRGFRSRPQKNGFRRRNNSQDHASQVYNISSNRNFKRNSLNPAQIEKTISKICTSSAKYFAAPCIATKQTPDSIIKRIERDLPGMFIKKDTINPQSI